MKAIERDYKLYLQNKLRGNGLIQKVFDQLASMHTKDKMIIKFTLTGAIGFFLALAPILDPYVFFKIGEGFTLKINDIIMLVLGFLCFSQNHKTESKTNYLVILLMGLTFINIIANMYNNISMFSSLKSLIVYFVYAVILTYLWKTECRESFLHWVQVFATLASILVILQFFFGYLDLPMWDGQLSFFELGGYDQWSGYIDRNTGAIRPNGIFQEASYVGIYLSVAYTQSFSDGRFGRIILYAIAMLMTTSLLAVFTCIIITVYVLIARNKMRISKKTSRRIFWVIVILVSILFVFITVNEAAQESFSYIFDRVDGIDTALEDERDSSTKIRLLGNIELFDRYDTVQKFFGLGIAQYSVFFDIKAYSNVWVVTILNSGIVGISFLVFVLFWMLKRMKTENRAFFIILLLVFSVDYQWFSWYFFYMFTACLLESEPKESPEKITV